MPCSSKFSQQQLCKVFFWHLGSVPNMGCSLLARHSCPKSRQGLSNAVVLHPRDPVGTSVHAHPRAMQETTKRPRTSRAGGRGLLSRCNSRQLMPSQEEIFN